jgi:D-psicose/D-tagatose/L-ribulose 3-epimerase
MRGGDAAVKYGICGDTAMAAIAADHGYDFFETTVAGLLKPSEEDASFRQAFAAVKAAALPCEAVNCFIPGDLKITGPQVDFEALKSFATIACGRAGEAGVEIIVFGSGGARAIPDGYDRTAAMSQIVRFCEMLGPVAGEHGVTIAVEPLNAAECNILTTVGESADLVRRVDHPAVRLLVDGYHWGKDDDSAEDVVAAGDLLVHAHVATTTQRLAPGAEPCAKMPAFFECLAKAGYNGRISVEGVIPNPPEDLGSALVLMKKLATRP